jgi:hypothetical protein
LSVAFPDFGKFLRLIFPNSVHCLLFVARYFLAGIFIFQRHFNFVKYLKLTFWQICEVSFVGLPLAIFQGLSIWVLNQLPRKSNFKLYFKLQARYFK